ncbi:hypothetical protein [Stenotrophomonas maltophilia]|uniref:hypothetical protein n=1 Tax=Stenotrophomonas maltophilia TaxID=40324 RepID=UPI0015DF832E|nr:hypothetical protein [Stenotrophomonas maltophilia]MBA0284483.1 hypothetical protein [Stenotrophomonas maltophilia]MBA0323750.1 hypothetical protein [Stenotrophomonas maltophilia]
MDTSSEKQASLETTAAAQLQHASTLESDRSGSWKARARRQRSAARLRASASAKQRAANRLVALDLPEDLPF